MTTSAAHGPRLTELGGATPRGYEGFGGTVATRASASEPWWPEPVRAPEGAPNVIVMLVDDLGYSDIEPFGGEIPTPALREMADEGYRFTDFRVTPLCAPSRAALLTGANPHRAGFGMVPHLDPGFPGMRMSIPAQLPTLAESFRAGGYATFMVGKWHLTPEAKMHDGAEKSSWPLQRGFDRYFGSLEGMTTLFHPHRLVRDNSPVLERFADDDYLTDRLTDEAIGMIDAMRAGDGTRPFFLYFAHHAVHGPVQAKPADIERSAGVYEAGWDALRRQRFARQVELGIVAPDVELAGRDAPGFDDTVPWNELSEGERECYARHMQVYAGAVAAVDDSVARLMAHLKEIGEYENTIFVFTSDNGGTDEGGETGTRSYFSRFVHDVPLPEDWNADVDRPLEQLGGPRVFGHYPRGWAHVSNTPFRAYKGSSYEGGIRSPLILAWPAGAAREARDTGIRTGFAYVTDLAPTLLELAGVERPQCANGLPTIEADGTSLVTLLRDPLSPPARPDGQYLALLGQRAYFWGRWKLVVPARRPGDAGPPPQQLFDLERDPTEQEDVASRHPELVAELGERWRIDAWHNTVFPVLDTPESFAAVPSTVLELSRPVTLRVGTPPLERYRSSRLIDKRSFTVEVRSSRLSGAGVLVAHGDQGGGYAAWIEDGVVSIAYNAYGVMHRACALLGGDETSLALRFTALPGIAWRIDLEVAARAVATIERVPMLLGLAPFTGISVGRDAGSPVDWELHERRGEFAYAGPPITVRYVPGEKAAYNREIVHAIDTVSARLMD
ncbi:arylsulfatase [Leucobacter allii]|uniref:arylsulfatase n=1 Tax=Leucobacter allii TaxID=2932247 RepID=UPI001FD32B7A|nr:arylsulfatase [Leucobacter allii]UOR01875.1 arylsulfatase [Leucobacter allii]